MSVRVADPQSPIPVQQISSQQKRAVAAECGTEQDGDIAGKDESHGQVQGLGEEGVEKIVGVDMFITVTYIAA